MSNEFVTFADLAVSSSTSVRKSSKEIVTMVMVSDNPEATMQELFQEFRSRYAAARISNAKTAMKDISDGWRNATNGMRYWFSEEGFAASWPQIRTGSGDCILKTKRQANDDSKARLAAQKERDMADALKAAEAQTVDQAAQLRSLSVSELAATLMETIRESGQDPKAVLTAMGQSMSLRIHKAPARKSKAA